MSQIQPLIIQNNSSKTLVVDYETTHQEVTLKPGENIQLVEALTKIILKDPTTG